MKITVTKRIEIQGKAVEYTASGEFPDRRGPLFRPESKALAEGLATDVAEERAAALFKSLPTTKDA
jgi:hypothetical protein